MPGFKISPDIFTLAGSTESIEETDKFDPGEILTAWASVKLYVDVSDLLVIEILEDGRNSLERKSELIALERRVFFAIG